MANVSETLRQRVRLSRQQTWCFTFAQNQSNYKWATELFRAPIEAFV